MKWTIFMILVLLYLLCFKSPWLWDNKLRWASKSIHMVICASLCLIYYMYMCCIRTIWVKLSGNRLSMNCVLSLYQPDTITANWHYSWSGLQPRLVAPPGFFFLTWLCLTPVPLVPTCLISVRRHLALTREYSFPSHLPCVFLPSCRN